MNHHDFKARINELQINGKLNQDDVIFITDYVNSLLWRMRDLEKYVKEKVACV